MFSDMMDIESPLTDERIDKIAHWVKRRRLETMAVTALELNKPLAFVESQAVLFGAHIFSMVDVMSGKSMVNIVYQLLSDRNNMERLMNRIEELCNEEREREIKEREQKKQEENGKEIPV